MGQLTPLNNMLANPLVSNLDVHFDVSRNLLKTAQQLNATEGYIFKNLEKDGELVSIYATKKDLRLIKCVYFSGLSVHKLLCDKQI